MEEITDEKRSADDSLGVLTTLLSNPDILSKMGDIIAKHTGEENAENRADGVPNTENSAISTDNSDGNKESSPTYANAPNDALTSLLPGLLGALGKQGAPHGSGHKSSNKEQTALLLAIRPYLSDHRREIVDTFIKMSKLMELLKNFT
ncbi:MAG: hypothetical protein ACI3XL_00590 [Eubacteriales bacterium]